MKKFLVITVLLLCTSNLVHAQNSFSFSIAGPGYYLSANNYLSYPYGYYYSQIPPPIITYQPYYRQPIQVLVPVCGPYVYTRDFFGNLLTTRNCWTEIRWQ